MASSIGGQIINPPDLSNAQLLADMQYFEPYSSAGLNRKFRNILLPGIYKGFDPSPGTGLNLLISSGTEGGACSLNIGDRYQITGLQLRDVTIALRAGTYVYVALEVNFSIGTLTDQIDINAPTAACRIVAVNVSQGLAANQLELCKVNIPSAARQITQSMIELNGRVMRSVGVRLTDRVDLQDSTIAASATAVKIAYDHAVAASGNKITMGDYGIGAETIQVTDPFDWQTYLFHGDEYVYINWQTAYNNPGIDYPPGYYQISVLGLSNTKNQSLMIRPVNYLDPLAPFMISWTGDVGNRVFKWRAVATSMMDINSLGTVTPNSLTRRAHEGTFCQPEDSQATSTKGYPIQEAGSLRVEPSSPAYDRNGMVFGGIMQVYTTSKTGRMFTRAQNSDGSFQVWKEYATLNNELMMNQALRLGVSASNDNALYLLNDANRLGGNSNSALSNAIVYELGTNRARAGILRGAGNSMLGYSVDVNGTERLRIVPQGEARFFNGNVAICGSQGALNFRNDSGSSLYASVTYVNQRLLLSNSDGSGIGILNNGMFNSGTPVGAEAAILRGAVEEGALSGWKGRGAGLLVDMGSNNVGYNIWKAIRTGVDHVAGMQVSYNPQGQVTTVNLFAGSSGLNYTSNGDLDGIRKLTFEEGYTGTIHMMSGSSEKGFINCDSSGVINLSVNGHAWQFGTDGKLTGPGRADFEDVWIRSDRAVKRAFKPIAEPLQKLQKLTGYLYELQNGEDWNQSGGLVAQEVADVMPELVAKDNNGLLRLNYNGIIGLLVNAVNALAEAR